MKQSITIFLCCCFFLKATTQNLVPNPSFENYSSCPTNNSQINLATPWIDPTGASSDYFNSCATGLSSVSVPFNGFGYQKARNGDAYAGFYVFANSGSNYREYIQVGLIDSLTAGVIYRTSFYVSSADNFKYSSDGVGAYFSKIAITGSPGPVLNYTAQVENLSGNIITDTAGWTLITGTFTALGGEKYITIGNFKADTASQTAIVNNSSTYPAYWVYFYIDDISVYPDSETVVNELAINKVKFKLYPNPNNGTMLLDYSLNSTEKGELMIYDLTGKKIITYSLNNANSQLQINDEEFNNGIYIYHIVVNDKIQKSDKLVIIK